MWSTSNIPFLEQQDTGFHTVPVKDGQPEPAPLGGIGYVSLAPTHANPSERTPDDVGLRSCPPAASVRAAATSSLPVFVVPSLTNRTLPASWFLTCARASDVAIRPLGVLGNCQRAVLSQFPQGPNVESWTSLQRVIRGSIRAPPLTTSWSSGQAEPIAYQHKRLPPLLSVMTVPQLGRRLHAQALPQPLTLALSQTDARMCQREPYPVSLVPLGLGFRAQPQRLRSARCRTAATAALHARPSSAQV